MKLSLLTTIRRSVPLATSIFTLTLVSAASAVDTATTAWNNAGTDWATATNWASGAPSTSKSALFNTSFTNQPQLGTGTTTAQGIWLATGVGQDVTIGTSDGTTQRTLTITGTATLSGQPNAGIILDDTGDRNLTIGSSATDPLVVGLSNSTGFYVNNAGTLTLQGNKNLAIGSNILTLGGTNASGKIVISRAINGTGSVIVNTAGSVTLNNQNTLAGTTLTAGTLNINHAKALGVVATSTFAINGGTLDNTSGGAITASFAYPITIGGNFSFKGTNDLSLGAGAVDLTNATRTITGNAGTLTLGGVISNGGLTKAGNGTLALSGASNYTGTTTVNAGTLLIASGGSIGTTSKITVASGATIQNNNGAAIIRALTLTEGSSLITNASGSSFTTSNGLELVGNLSDGWSAIALTNTAGSGLIKGGTLTLTLSGITANTYDLDGSSTGFSGSFSSVSVGTNSLSTSDGGATFTGSNIGGFNYSFTNSTNTLIVTSAVPEPSTWIGGGLIVGLAAWSQRKRFAA